MRSSWAICLVSFFFAACTAVKAPRGSVPTMVKMGTDVYGGWITLHLNDSSEVAGELIAVSGEQVIICRPGETRPVPLAQITTAQLVMFKTQEGGYATWTFLNSLLTVANGFFLIFTLPVNLVTGISTSTSEGRRENSLDYPATDWSELSKYARFPQGLPEGVELGDILSRTP